MRHKILLLLAVSLILFVAVTSIPKRAGADGSGKIELGETVVGGMEVEAELEPPSAMQMYMMGKWMLMKPTKDDTHHLEVKTSVPGKGYRIPYADVRATFIHLQSKEKFSKKAAPMFGGNFHYGTNVTLKKGKYEVIIDVAPPAMMRMEESIGKWLKPVQVKFQFEVK